MNYRFWGGWFLVVALLAIGFTIGCDNSLGVKKASISGQLVDGDTLEPIAGGLVRMLGYEAAETDAKLQQINTFASVLSDEDGYFVFENVNPDNVIFQISAPGYIDMTYPSNVSNSTSTSGGSDSDSSSTSTSDSEVEYVSILSGSHIDVRQIRMYSTGVAPVKKVTARIDLYDATTKKPISANEGYDFTVIIGTNSFTNQKITKLKYDGVQINSGDSLNVTIQNTNGIYKEYSGTINASGDSYYRFELEPIGFNLLVRAVNVPDYVGSYPIQLYVETLDDPPLSIQVASAALTFPLNTGDTGTFVTIPVSNAKDGFRIRAEVRGYDDMVARIQPNILNNNNNQTRRIDFDFAKREGTSEKIFSSGDEWIFGVMDYMQLRMVQWKMQVIPTGNITGREFTSNVYYELIDYAPYNPTVESQVGVCYVLMHTGYTAHVTGQFGTKIGEVEFSVNTFQDGRIQVAPTIVLKDPEEESGSGGGEG